MYTDILVRFGELSTKGKNKITFINQLAKNIKLLAHANPRVEHDRIFIDYSEETMKNLQYVFGIYSYSPTVRTSSDLKTIENTVLKLIKSIEGKTFKVDVTRHWKAFPMSSMDLMKHLGGVVLKDNPNLTVDVHNPDIKIEVEIRQNLTYVFVQRVLGLGGYPTGINGRVLHLISGGIDSPVAAFEMMKRGIHVDFLNFITPPHTDQRTIDKVDKIINLLIKYQGQATLYRSNYTDLQNLIGLTSKQAYKINLMRRSFYRIASELAIKQNYLGLSNGENLGQVASQTLESIATIASQSKLPIYRPLVTADKLETINKARKLGTYEINNEKCIEACEFFAPTEPVTKPREHVSEQLENELFGLKDMEKKNLETQIEMILFRIN